MRRADLRHTLVGYGIHHSMSIFWGLIHEQLFHRRPADSIPQNLAKAVATGAIAAFVDYKLAPRRLQPGFDRQLSPLGLACVYAAFAFGLAMARRRNSRFPERR